MNSKNKVFLAHDPGGYDVVRPVVERFRRAGLDVEFYCVGPAANLNPLYAATEEEVCKIINHKLKMYNISTLITGTSWGNDFELRMIQLCILANVVTISILDYWSNYTMRFRTSEGRLMYPHYYIMMDDLAKNEALIEGVPPNIVHVMGHPGLDSFIQNNISLNVKYPKQQYKILFLSQPISQLNEIYGFTEQTVLNDCIQAIASNSYCELHVKFHPKDSLEFQVKYEGLSVQGDLRELIPNYNIIIGMSTIGLLHAALMHKIVLSYQPGLLKPDPCITNKLGLTQVITTFENLCNKLNEIVEGVVHSDINVIKVDYIWMDGQSTERIFCFLQEVTML